MAGLRREQVDGRWASVAYLAEFGGALVEPADAQVAIVTFENGEMLYLQAPPVHLSYRDKLARLSLGVKWDEELHPRDADGKFAEGGGGGEVGTRQFDGSTVISGTKSDGGKIVAKLPRQFDKNVAEDVLGRSVNPAELAGEMLGALPGDVLNVEVTTSAGVEDPEVPILPSVTLTAESRGPSGALIAKTTRTFTRDETGTLEVHHDYFKLSPALQGSGVAKEVLRDSVAAYEKLGVEMVSTDANLNVGGYAWAKFGFVAEKPDRFARSIQAEYGHLSESQRAAVDEVLTDYAGDPRLPWHIAGLYASGRGVSGTTQTHIGKDLMMRTEWNAKLPLKDKEAMAKFHAYVSK